MKTCRECVEFLCDYLENALPAGQRAEFDEHLSKCSCCRAFVETYRKTMELTGGCRECEKKTYPPLPEELIRAILSARGSPCAKADGGSRDGGHAPDRQSGTGNRQS